MLFTYYGHGDKFFATVLVASALPAFYSARRMSWVQQKRLII